MKKVMKIFAILIVTLVIINSSTPISFGAGDPPVVKGPDLSLVHDSTAGKLETVSGKIIGFLQLTSAIAAVVLISVFGFKFILGSANEKAEYQKSFIPLIIGVVVVFAATSIAKLLFGIVATN